MSSSPFSRWKNAAKRLADRVLGDEGWQPPPTPTVRRVPERSVTAAGSPVPRVQPGTGDTPGPNHRTDIGRTWLSAQIVSGVAPFVVDLRSADDFARGHVPGARHLQGDRAFDTTRLPPKEDAVVVCDATGFEDSDRVATALRDKGWIGARRLVGGFVEWAEAGEPVERGAGATTPVAGDDPLGG
jgi:rhodanese-related sulfurtransferase